MGNPIKDTVDDFDAENSPFLDCPDNASIEHLRKKHKEAMYDMVLKDIEEEPFDMIDIPDIFPWEHDKNVKKMQKTEAIKNDIDKTRMDLLPPKALEGIAKIFTFGAKKYNDHNYKNGKGLDWDRPYAACMRHLNAWNDGEDIDPESGKSHLYHAGCCIMMLIDLVDSNIGDDKRYESVDE